MSLSTEARISKLERAVDRLERIIQSMTPRKETWVGPTVITNLTAWDGEGMRRARRNGSVKYRRNPKTNGYQYLASSIPERLLKITGIVIAEV
jgi:hypothetical protein